MIAPSSNHLLLLIFSTYSEDLTLFDRRAYFGPLKTQGKADLPQAFSSSHGGCDLLKNWLAIKFSQKSLIYDPVQGHIGLKSKIPEICSRIIRLQKTVQNKKCSHFARHLCGNSLDFRMCGVDAKPTGKVLFNFSIVRIRTFLYMDRSLLSSVQLASSSTFLTFW